jgi:lysyl-tRNA synthetase class 2
MATVEETSEQEYFQERVDALKDIEQYPHKFEVSIPLAEYRDKYDHLEKNQYDFDTTHTVSGRLTAVRASSKKLHFYRIVSAETELQVMVNKMYYKEDAKYDMKTLSKILRKGDIIGIVGHPTRTKTGELSILGTDVIMLAPSYHVIPRQLKDKGLRYRNRHVDFLVNKESRDKMYTRSRIVQYLRNFLIGLGFIEVETPMMHPIAGGASAKPFVTHHNALNSDFFLRVAPELYLKRAVVSGFERVFEIGKQYRNESIDLTHNPEFTTCEFYWAYADYFDLMNVTEELLSGMVSEIRGSPKVTYGGVGIDFTAPFRRISMMDELEKQLGVEFPDVTYDSDEMGAFFEKVCSDRGIVVPEPKTNARLLDRLVSTYIEPMCVNPTFITDYPLILSPLAKVHRSNPQLTERFELFINGTEYCNAYTELNDPFDQRQRFIDQVKDRDKGDDEAQDHDEEYCRVLEYGLPPTAGWGLGIDRLTMMLTDSDNIKEVIMFPAMRIENESASD